MVAFASPQAPTGAQQREWPLKWRHSLGVPESHLQPRHSHCHYHYTCRRGQRLQGVRLCEITLVLHPRGAAPITTGTTGTTVARRVPNLPADIMVYVRLAPPCARLGRWRATTTATV